MGELVIIHAYLLLMVGTFIDDHVKESATYHIWKEKHMYNDKPDVVIGSYKEEVLEDKGSF